MSKKRVDNETIVAILEKARALISARAFQYVCNAIRSGTRPGSPAYALAKWIGDHMDGCGTAEDWLWYVTEVSAQNLGRTYMIQWRLRWIESMIEDAKAGRIKIYVEE